ncbi:MULTISPECIES: peptidase S8 and S53 subtilisin kexin sedolisin [unclassified Meiothermus]|uniref:peptidase S8 and S53 subtilisin kexin sedolisin n=1 Tax=unclassified Meiothermus TaxID=370471 RepID=UPI000D7C05E4|nr:MULTISPECIES: peptidase S8 and S53 subtilisin kexin sedolisin [unclassified Meiothermus]PZA05980.1 peptidase S8 and S53 subtilisin kexin sedolisin [Meiothermus sp. Pnk-1]RYM29117.1 peptidase S8 and S53 subtilisin kexin sedolisin [Meiothermus sp. PNK-Is4]
MVKPIWLLAVPLTLFLAACGGGASPPPGSVTLTVVDGQNVGYAAAYQVGSGSWTAFTPSSGNTYTFSLGGSTTYGVAVRCNSTIPGNPPEVYVIQATPSELANPKVTCSEANPGLVSYTLNVDVSAVPGVASGDLVRVSGRGFGAGGTVMSVTTPVAVNLMAPAGTQDLLVTVSASGNPVNFKAAKVLRGVSVTSGGTGPLVFAAADALSPASVTVSPPSGFTPSFAVANVNYVSNDNKGSGQVGYASGTAAASFLYRPVSGFGSGDRYVVFATAGDSANVLERFLGTNGGPMVLALPNPWPSGSLSVSALAHPVVSGLSYSNSNVRAYEVHLEDSTLIYQITLSKGWLSGSSYTVPDLSAQLGYTPFAGSVYVSVSALLSPVPVLSLDPNDPASFTATSDISLVHATGSYAVGGGTLTLP